MAAHKINRGWLRAQAAKAGTSNEGFALALAGVAGLYAQQKGVGDGVVPLHVRKADRQKGAGVRSGAVSGGVGGANVQWHHRLFVVCESMYRGVRHG